MTATPDIEGGQVLTGPWIARPGQQQAETSRPVLSGEVLPARGAPVPARPRLSDPVRVPAWLSDRAVASRTVRYAGVLSGRVLLRGTWRAPVAVLRGTWRAGRMWWHWVRAEDVAIELRDPTSGRMGRDVVVVRKLRGERWKITGAVVAGGSIGEIIADAMVGGWVPAATGGAVVLAAGVAGRYRRAPGEASPWAGEPDPRRDLAPEHLNDAFRAAGLLKADTALVLCAPIVRDRHGRGWETVLDLPRGAGKTAAHAIGKADVIAAELGVDEIQLIMSRVRAHAGGHGRRLSLWVADDDPYLGTPIRSELIEAERFDFWTPVPFGRDARGNRIDVLLLWQSAFFGGLPRRGKTFSMRLLVAAAVLDPWCQVWLADGKGGADFRAMAGVAHRYVAGADVGDLAAFEAMLDELITEMSRRFAFLATLSAAECPEGKLTPEIMRRYRLPLIPFVIDELQEYFEALDEEKDRKRVVGKLARIARRGPAAGIMPVYASQRPDAQSVPTKLREIVTYRYCTQVTDRTSSDMVLGDGKARAGADASILSDSEHHKGVGVLVTGPDSFVVVKADLLDNGDYERVCQRGRALRLDEGTLTGDACGDLASAAASRAYVIPTVIADVLEAFGRRARMWTDDILSALVNIDEDAYGEWTGTELAEALEGAGVKRTMKQVKIDGDNRAGWLLRDIEGAMPADVLAARPVEGAPATAPEA
ncbi:FtsK/SpoIIIE domain-containing protein [Parafrankia sp. BMG5.11]|uniref:FtsK/SpoIIIE domain-containing protein n=1 Tax=Parafrankia sp. BMG5.11 TaxID=222540 RepID=UPI00103EA782|nr:FtsK/SpoIIIE domain-containing protein [Parafrankia sp. BMG5.11]TCJ40708.1 cell division protein FtsK [Parafrankia sp. BMG5.11]